MDLEVKTRVIKRNGEEVDFRLEKIVNAIKKANEEVENIHRMNDFQIIAIAEKIAQQAEEFTHAVNVEDIQDMVETGIMEMRGYEVAQKYVRYRYKRELTRKSNTTDNGILALIDHMNEEVKQENSNKNPVINSTQRDYMAGEVSKDLTKRVLLPEEIVRAHEEGIIHFHDMDYFAQKEHNCDLINLEDMLQNGTVISETMIEKPHSFFTACNVTTQIVAQVASNQYGGQSFTLSHLAPFVDVSRQKLRKSVIEERIESGEVLDDAIIDKITERRLRTEVQSGIQTIQYQLITLMTCNGQAPFVTVFMYLDEVPEGRTRDDLAMIIEEVMKQRMQGVKNEKGVWITPAFPKLIYVLDEDNITEDSKYWYLTELAAKCTAKRMVPDYISAKIMKELKNGDVYPCMGCRSFLTVEDSQRNADGSHKFYGRFNQGVVTINLVDVACSAEGNMERFWEILDERLELCHRALRCRHERLLGTVSDVAPILDDAIIDKITERRLRTEVQSGIQTIQYQLITLMTCNGQAPFVTVFMYLDEVPEGRTRDDLAMIIEEVMKQRMQGVKNEKGVWITPAFPKLIYVLDEDNITEDSKYWYLTELAAKCTAKRMVPDYISAKIMKELKNGDVYPCMGCRSFLTVEDSQRNADGSHKFYGRFNQGVVTINLVDVACSAEGNMERFWEILDERLELCHRALRCRHERLLGTVSDVAPILWQNGALARLKKGETIDKLLFDGYSTISLGYAGLYEMCMRMLGKSHTDPEAKPFALAVMQRLNDKCKEWKEAENISYSVYGTPMESTTYKFAKCLQKRFGIIPGVTDKNYITNSYHVHVTEKIDAFSKLKFESEFQKLSPGGAISYIEVPNMQTNIPAVLSVLQYIYGNIMYAELNTKSDFCEVCGYDGEIKIIEDETGKLVWECPNCGNRDQDKLFVARRTCGYIGTQFWNQGRTQEIKDRVLHL